MLFLLAITCYCDKKRKKNGVEGDLDSHIVLSVSVRHFRGGGRYPYVWLSSLFKWIWWLQICIFMISMWMFVETFIRGSLTWRNQCPNSSAHSLIFVKSFHTLIRHGISVNFLLSLVRTGLVALVSYFYFGTKLWSPLRTSTCVEFMTNGLHQEQRREEQERPGAWTLCFGVWGGRGVTCGIPAFDRTQECADRPIDVVFFLRCIINPDFIWAKYHY